MEENVFTAKILLTGLIAAGSAIWGWFGWLVLLWFVCMALDYATGTLAAMKRGEWSSDVAREGLWHKGGMILVVAVAALTDLAVTLILRLGIPFAPVRGSVALTALALAWYTLTELGSTLENAARITRRVPSCLTRFLKAASDAVDREEADDGERA